MRRGGTRHRRGHERLVEGLNPCHGAHSFSLSFGDPYRSTDVYDCIRHRSVFDKHTAKDAAAAATAAVSKDISRMTLAVSP